jgi:hypothetical protein
MTYSKTLFKRLFRLIFACTLLAAAVCRGTGSQNYLFIGNSFTFRHELKDVLLSLAKEGNQGINFRAERITYGGRDLFRHYELYRSQDLLGLQAMSDDTLHASMKDMAVLADSIAEPAFYTDYWTKISSTAMRPWEEYEAKSAGRSLGDRKSRWTDDRNLITSAIENHAGWIRDRASFPEKWDYVVLQSWLDITADPATGYFAYASKFVEKAKAQGTKVILYITAPYSQNASAVSQPVEAKRAIEETKIAAEFAKKNGALVVPVPLALYLLQKEGTTMSFRYKNDAHPNQRCAYLTACLFYAAIFDRSPEGLKLNAVTESKITDRKKPDCDPDGHPLELVLPDDERLLLQRIAWKTIETLRRGDY